MASILIVDDDDNLRSILADVLEVQGHDCVAVPSSDQAKEATAGRRFDLATVDLSLGGGESGADLARWLKEHCPGLPVICISGHLIDFSEDDLEEMGFTHCLPKPFELKQLKGAIDSALGIGA